MSLNLHVLQENVEHSHFSKITRLNTVSPPSLNELPVCILSTVAGFLDQQSFAEFVHLS